MEGERERERERERISEQLNTLIVGCESRSHLHKSIGLQFQKKKLNVKEDTL